VPTNTILALAVGTLRFAHPTSDSSRPGTALAPHCAGMPPILLVGLAPRFPSV